MIFPGAVEGGDALAIGHYRAFGYEFCEPFGDYRPDPPSVFLEKRLLH